jgi:hypothetical protein
VKRRKLTKADLQPLGAGHPQGVPLHKADFFGGTSHGRGNLRGVKMVSCFFKFWRRGGFLPPARGRRA